MLISQLLKKKGDMVATVAPTDSIAVVVETLAAHGIGALVVSSDGTVVDGIISERDIVRHLAVAHADTIGLTVGDLMTAEVVTCALDATTEQLMAEMTARRIRHVPVTSDGVLVGIVSIGDVVNARVHELEIETEQLTNYISGR
jgi:CBS domain-containing protein